MNSLRSALRTVRFPITPAVATLALLTTACQSSSDDGEQGAPGRQDPTNRSTGFVIEAGKPVPGLEGEKRLRNVRQLTFGGENAEAYWSFDGRHLVYQSRRPPEIPADQIFVLDLATGEERMVSTGKGRTTCAYFLKGDQRIVFASTHFAADEPPPPVQVRNGKYVWPIYETYEVYTVGIDGSDLRRITEVDGYDAEATVDPVTGRIVFTSMRDDDLELYTCAPDGSDVVRVTERVGYDGGAFFSHDGKRFILRSGFPSSEEEVAEYKALLSQGVVQPTRMEITVCDVDGSDFRQITDNGKANFAPFWHPDNHHILFCSNKDSASGRDFDIFLMDVDAPDAGIERVTFNESFDGFPMFSPDGKHLVFASNRYAAEEGNTNIFVAEWVENP